MKEELIRVLNIKLNDINNNINSLVELNNKIDGEKEKLAYATKVLNVFGKDEDYDILKFVELKREDFDKVLGIVENDSEKIFNTDSCNYDGLVYLINGINNGVSLTLTEEQKTAIEYLIRGLNEKKDEYEAVIDGLMLVKTRFEIDDLDILDSKKKDYLGVINKIDTNDYIDETEKIAEAMEFSHLASDEKINLLTFILEYNADIFKANGYKAAEKVTEVNTVETKDEQPAMDSSLKEQEEEEFKFKPFEMQDIRKIESEVPKSEVSIERNDDITFDDNSGSDEVEVYSYEQPEITPTEEVSLENEISFDEPMYEAPIEEKITEIEENVPSNVNIVDVQKSENQDFEEIGLIEDENKESAAEPQIEEQSKIDMIDKDFDGIVTSSDDYEEEKIEDETISTRELQRLLGEFGLANIEINNYLLSGNINNYRKVIECLKQNDLLDRFSSNKELMQDVLVNSGEEEIETVLKIIKDELSVDEDDYIVTTKIAVDTLPTIFIKDGGNYDNFVKNIKLFKNIGLDLISLFDFSKEVFIVDNEFALNNYNIVKMYDVKVDYKNAKYLLMLPNIAEKMDYYIESVYIDKTKGNEKFDGINYINNYAVKLNSVCDLTIKRLRYASESGNRVFGSKPNSLTGEITNMKVNALDISDEYLNKFFNNEFDGISLEETREYTKLIRNSSNVGNYSDELDILSKYHNGLRYVIEGIIISYNKTVRIYNILRSYGINNTKALHFALCYNLVITKDEYEKIKRVINELGGNA